MPKQKPNEAVISKELKDLLKSNQVNLLLFKESLGVPTVKIPEFETLKGGLRAYEMTPEQNSEVGQLILKKCREIFDAETANSEMDLTYFEGIFMEDVEKLLSYDPVLQEKHQTVWHKLAEKELERLNGINAYLRIKEIAHKAKFGSYLKMAALDKANEIILKEIKKAKLVSELQSYHKYINDEVELIRAYNISWDLIITDTIKGKECDSYAAQIIFESAREGSVGQNAVLLAWNKAVLATLKGYQDNAEAIYEEIKEMPHHLSAFKEGERLIKEWLEKPRTDSERSVEDFLFLFQDGESPLNPEILTLAATIVQKVFQRGRYNKD